MTEKRNVSECLVRGKCQFGVWRLVLPKKVIPPQNFRYPVLVSDWCKSYPVYCEHGLTCVD